MSDTPIQRAAQIAGSQSALARLIGRTPQAVQKWCNGAKVPGELVIPVEQAVDGKVSRHELRPDLYPTEQAEQGA